MVPSATLLDAELNLVQLPHQLAGCSPRGDVAVLVQGRDTDLVDPGNRVSGDLGDHLQRLLETGALVQGPCGSGDSRPDVGRRRHIFLSNAASADRRREALLGTQATKCLSRRPLVGPSGDVPWTLHLPTGRRADPPTGL